MGSPGDDNEHNDYAAATELVHLGRAPVDNPGFAHAPAHRG